MPGFVDHHFKQFYGAGHPVVLCTDDSGKHQCCGVLCCAVLHWCKSVVAAFSHNLQADAVMASSSATPWTNLTTAGHVGAFMMLLHIHRRHLVCCVCRCVWHHVVSGVCHCCFSFQPQQQPVARPIRAGCAALLLQRARTAAATEALSHLQTQTASAGAVAGAVHWSSSRNSA